MQDNRIPPLKEEPDWWKNKSNRINYRKYCLGELKTMVGQDILEYTKKKDNNLELM